MTTPAPEAVARLWGEESLVEGGEAGTAPSRALDEERLEEVGRSLRTLAPFPTAAKNPPTIFVLSPPRSGSTLLRVMLGGHPDLFAPPELELLSFIGMAERRSTFTGRDVFWITKPRLSVVIGKFWRRKIRTHRLHP